MWFQSSWFYPRRLAAVAVVALALAALVGDAQARPARRTVAGQSNDALQTALRVRGTSSSGGSRKVEVDLGNGLTALATRSRLSNKVNVQVVGGHKVLKLTTTLRQLNQALDSPQAGGTIVVAGRSSGSLEIQAGQAARIDGRKTEHVLSRTASATHTRGIFGGETLVRRVTAPDGSVVRDTTRGVSDADSAVAPDGTPAGLEFRQTKGRLRSSVVLRNNGEFEVTETEAVRRRILGPALKGAAVVAVAVGAAALIPGVDVLSIAQSAWSLIPADQIAARAGEYAQSLWHSTTARAVAGAAASMRLLPAIGRGAKNLFRGSEPAPAF